MDEHRKRILRTCESPGKRIGDFTESSPVFGSQQKQKLNKERSSESSERGMWSLSGYHADTPITIKAEASSEADSRIH